MKSKVYSGWISRCPFGFLALSQGEEMYPNSLADQITRDWKVGDKVFVYFYVTDRKATLEEAQDSFVRKTFGELEANYMLEAYSEYTIEYWEEGLKLGGHDMIEELYTFEGKYLNLVVEKK